MSILRKLFARSEPAPFCEVDPADASLVHPEDDSWWTTLSAADVELIAKEDNLFKVAVFKKLMEEDGVSKASAVIRVRKAFPVYYLRRSDREAGDGFTGRDAKLPYLLKNRVNRFVQSELAREPDLLSKATSFNALVRQMIENGRL